MECQYCKKMLCSKSSLTVHQNTTKYCLKLQGNLPKKSLYICSFCQKDFHIKNNLDRHISICTSNNIYVKNLQQKNLEYRQQILLLCQEVENLKDDKKTLQDSYTELAKTLAKRSITTNNTINNNLNLAVFNKTQADIKRIVDEKYDKEYLMEGQKGVARFTNSHVLNTIEDNQQPMYLITDKTRCNGKYRVSENEVVTDNGMMGLTKKIHPSIKKKAVFIAAEGDAMNDEELFRNFQEVFEMNEDNTVFRKEMIRILDNVI